MRAYYNIFNIQKSKPEQEDVSSVTSEHQVEQHSVSQMTPKENIEDFERSTEAQVKYLLAFLC